MAPAPLKLFAAVLRPTICLDLAGYSLPAGDPAAMPPGLGSPGPGDISALPGE